MKHKILVLGVLQVVFCGALCYAQYSKERQWRGADIYQHQAEQLNPFERERVVRNKIMSIEESEYSYSFGELEQKGTKTITKKYDASGNKTYHWELAANEEYSFRYDQKGRRIESILLDSDHLSNGRPSRTTTTYEYSDNGDLLKKSWDNCLVGGASCKETYEYDGYNREIKYLRLIGDAIADKLAFKYDDKGRRIEKVRFAKDGTSTSTAFTYDASGTITKDDSFTYKYDSKQRLAEKASLLTSKGIPDQRYKYSYDDKGNKIEELFSAPPMYFNDRVLNPAVERKTAYRYNALGQVVQENRWGDFKPQARSDDTITYAYDDRGNVTEEVGQYLHLAGSKLTYKYDGKGNILEIAEFDLKGVPKKLTRFVYAFYSDVR